MRPEAISLASPVHRSLSLPHSKSQPTSSSSFNYRFHKNSIRILHVRNQKPQENLQTTRSIRNPEPPWRVLPPPVPENPFSGDGRLFDLQVKGVGTGIPSSLRLVQLKKKRLASRRSENSVELDSIGKAIQSLVFMLVELQRTVLSGDNEVSTVRVLRETADSIVWPFQKVFFTNPNLLVGLLVLIPNIIVPALTTVAEEVKLIEKEDPKASDSRSDPPEISNYASWSEIGIMEETEKRMKMDDECQEQSRRRRAYEQMIATEKANSLILSNYAQFLYQIEKDLERADDYFSLAVRAEPVDAEAMSRYAVFLWRERGDIGRAEEMFLEAIEAEPENCYHQSSYAWFLWKTGGVDTCYPLDDHHQVEL